MLTRVRVRGAWDRLAVNLRNLLRPVDIDEPVPPTLSRPQMRAADLVKIRTLSVGQQTERDNLNFVVRFRTLAVGPPWTAFGGEVSRVWLHTNNFDHSSALPNYVKRGFTIASLLVLPLLVLP